MVRRSTVFVVILFAVLLAALLLWQRYKKPSTASSTPEATSAIQNLFSFSESDVSAFSIADTTGRSVSFSKDANNAWVLAGQTASTTISTTVESTLSSIVSLTSMAKMEPSIAPEQIGLIKPSKTLTIQTADGKKYTLDIGSVTAIGSGYYARLDGNAPVVVGKYTLDTVLALLDKPPIVPTATAILETPTIPATSIETPATAPEPTMTPTP